MTISKNQLRYRYADTADALQGKRVSYDSAFDGRHGLYFWDTGTVGDYPKGDEGPADSHSDLSSPYIKAYLWTVCPMMDGVVGVRVPADLRVAPMQRNVNGARCVILDMLSPTGRSAGRSLAVDPTKDFAIVQYTYHRESQEGQSATRFLKVQLDVEYAFKADSRVWLPASWKYMSFADTGGLGMSAAGVVTESEINPVIGVDEFAFAFPPGTWVGTSSARGGESQYIVEPDGSKRGISLSAAQHATYDELLTGKSRDHMTKVWSWLSLISLAVGGIPLMFLWWRARCRNGESAVQ